MTAGLFLTPRQLCKRWGDEKTPEALRMDRYRGVGPKFVRISPKRVVYRLADVEAFERAHTFARSDDVPAA